MFVQDSPVPPAAAGVPIMCAQRISPPDRDPEEAAQHATALQHHPKTAQRVTAPQWQRSPPPAPSPAPNRGLLCSKPPTRICSSLPTMVELGS